MVQLEGDALPVCSLPTVALSAGLAHCRQNGSSEPPTSRVPTSPVFASCYNEAVRMEVSHVVLTPHHVLESV